MSETVISVKHVFKTYDSLVAVNDLRFDIPEAICYGFLGPNGAGKTTMMKMLYGKALPDKRDDTLINVFGYDPRGHELEIKHLSGLVPQDNDLDVELNVFQNLMIFSKLYGMSTREAGKKIEELLDFMELKDKKKAKIRELSGGMKRRLIITRALLNDPKLLILDEPTTGLDPQVRQVIWDRLRNLKRRGVTIILTTHYMEEAFQIADTVLIMDKGLALMEGNPKELMERNIESHVLELINVEKAKDLESMNINDDVRKEESDERVLYYSKDVGMLEAMVRGLEPGEFYLRQTNLEDLFLKATGRKLHGDQ
jgi:lipooligosaccharide transport system ATP-binding protein